MENENKQIDSDSGKTIAIISYLTFVGLIIAFIMNNDKKDEFAKFHIRQSLGIVLSGIVLSVLNVIPILGQLLYLLGTIILLYMTIMGIINAINKKENFVPILGKQYAEWFKSV